MFTDVSGNSEENELEGKRLEQRKKLGIYTTVQIRNVDHRGILLSHKATYTGIRYSMDGPRKRYAK